MRPGFSVRLWPQVIFEVSPRVSRGWDWNGDGSKHIKPVDIIYSWDFWGWIILFLKLFWNVWYSGYNGFDPSPATWSDDVYNYLERTQNNDMLPYFTPLSWYILVLSPRVLRGTGPRPLWVAWGLAAALHWSLMRSARIRMTKVLKFLKIH